MTDNYIREDDWNDNALLMVEELASRFHQVYQEELKRQGKKSKHSNFFSQLPKDIADLDRALARYVIKFVIPRTQDEKFITSAIQKDRERIVEELEKKKINSSYYFRELTYPEAKLSMSYYNKALDTAITVVGGNGDTETFRRTIFRGV